MSPKERYRHIRSLMALRDVTNAKIARIAKVSRTRVYKVMIGTDAGYRIRRIIAAEVGQPVENLWPDTPLDQRRAA